MVYLITLCVILCLALAWSVYFNSKIQIKTKRAIKDLEEHLNVATEYVFNWDSWIDASGNLIWVNSYVEKLTGYSSEECLIMENYPIPIIDKDYKDLILSVIHRGLMGEAVENTPFIIKHKEGKKIWGTISCSPVRNSNYDKAGVRISIRDYTEIKKTEDDLKLNKNQVNTILDTAKEGFFSLNEEAQFKEVNQAMCDIMGKTKKDVIGANIFNFVEGPYKSILEKNILNKKRKFDRAFEIHFMRESGRLVPCLINLTHKLNDKNEIVGCFAMVTDITRLKSTEKALQENKKFLDGIINNSSALICAKDLNGKYIMVNRKWKEVFDLTDKQVIGKTVFDVFPKHVAKTFHESDQKVIENKKIIQEEITFTLSEEKSYLAVHFPLINENKEVFSICGIATDITKMKNAEKELIVAKDIAEEANKTKSRFLASMSHEIRTPMNAILGFADLLSVELENQHHLSFVNSILTSGRNLLGLINDILDLSKIEAGRLDLQYELVNMLAIFNELESMFTLKANQKGLDLLFEIDRDVPAGLYIDEIRIKQIIMNLISNALKFTDKGHIKIIARAVNKHSFNLKEKKENYINLIIEIIDTGIGISKEFQHKMFDSFTQQDGQSTKKYGGTGLGLSITKKLVNIMQGTINVESSLNKGAKFILEFKDILTSDVETEILETKKININNIKFTGSTVLIADDIEINRYYLNNAMANKSLNLVEAIDGNEAFEKILEHQPDLILTDLKMPIIDGFELAKKVKSDENLKKIPIIALTASVLKEDKLKIKESNFDGYLLKPIMVQDLYKLLIDFLPHHVSMDEPVTEKKEADHKTELKEVVIPNEIKNLLTTDLMKKWESFKTKQPVNEIKKFANQIKTIGEEHNIQLLSKYSDNLHAAVGSFDIEQILRQLNEYPVIINKLVDNK